MKLAIVEKELGTLSSDDRLTFFELLAHNLTIAARAAWATDGIQLAEQVEALKIFNECQHRITARIRVQRLNTHEWTDRSFISLLNDTDMSLPPKLRGSVERAALHSLENITKSGPGAS